VTYGPVTCLSVTGNVAVLNFRDQGVLAPRILTVVLTDTGNGPDVLSWSRLGRAPWDCSPPAPSADRILETFTSGGATVVDAPPLPTFKGQCMSGGFAQFGFVNQGQCIKFVNHPWLESKRRARRGDGPGLRGLFL
jgi:hypothetical protein